MLAELAKRSVAACCIWNKNAAGFSACARVALRRTVRHRPACVLECVACDWIRDNEAAAVAGSGCVCCPPAACV
jgi:hypothetical protein